MVIQELSVPAVHEPAMPPNEVAQAQPPSLGSHPVAPALHFATAFSRTPAGFAPTSILIEIFGSLAHPGTPGSIAAGLLLGLTGIEPRPLTPAQPDGIRLTAYHCVHPLETRQYTATTNPLSFTES
jgi:hypothetical protein